MYLIQFNQCVPVLNICVAFQLTLVYVDDFYFQMTRPFSTLGKLRHFHFVTTLGCLWIECEHLRCVMRLVHLVLWKTLVYGLFNRDWKQKGSVDTLVFSVSDKIQPDCSHWTCVLPSGFSLVYLWCFCLLMAGLSQHLGKLRQLNSFVRQFYGLPLDGFEHCWCVMRLVHLVLWKTLVYGFV